VIALGNTHAWSGSDAGGKVATLRWMDQHQSLKPDVGYWAARWDPNGEHHPLIYTTRHGDQWVQVTSLPFVYAGLPLWKFGGTAAILLLPVAGSLVAAYGARRLALALGSADGWWAFWLVGLGAPMLFYAGDFWEHSMAVGLAVLALALALEAGAVKALAAGVLIGVAGVLRTEVLVYAAAVGVALLFVADVRQAWLRRPLRIVLLAAGFGAVFVTNTALERAAIGGGLRYARAGTNVAVAGKGLGQRLSDGVLTAVGLFSDNSNRALLLGGVLALALFALAAVAVGRRIPSLTGRATAVMASALYAVRFASIGFVPGFLPTTPVSAAGIVGSAPGRQRAIAVAAVAALPVVWALEWQGQLVPQWGGRYVLVSGALLTVVGAVALESRARTWASVLLLALAVAVSAFGAVWHAQRTRGVARAIAQVESAPRDVVIVSRIAHLGREGGAWYGRHRWLNASGDTGTVEAAGIAGAAGARRMDVIDLRSARKPLTLQGWSVTGDHFVPFLGFQLEVTRYTAT
jgi:hypothetical protein